LPLEVIIGTSIYRYVAPGNVHSFRSLIERGTGKEEIALRSAKGPQLPVYISASSLKIDESQEVRCIVVTDLHEKKMNEEIMASEKLARSIIEQATEAIVVCDGYGRIIRFSNAASRICGFDPMLLPFEDVFNLRQSSGDSAGERIHPVFEALQGTVLLKVEVTFHRADGRNFYLLINAGPLRNAEDNIIGSVVTLADISECKRVEASLRQAHDELEMRVKERTAELTQANAELRVAKEKAEAAANAKAAFMANMSHEIRTPMNAVIGMTSLLLEDELTADQKDYVETIRNSGNALMVIINDILDFSKMESGRVKLEHQPFNLRSCIEESMDLVAQLAAKKNLSLRYKLDYNVPENIFGDPTRLRQVLGNLLDNAVKFTDVGEVSISIESTKIEEDLYEIQFAVKDTGIGIPDDSIGKLFHSFSQLDMTNTRKYGGTGLGLVISKQLLEMMGGHIWVESKPGKGSIFYFTIQAEAVTKFNPPELVSNASSASGLESSARKAKSDPSALRILLAEDNTSNQKVAIQMLRKLGYRADLDANGVEVLQALERQPYDIVLMDIKMPEMDGLMATREIRKRWKVWPQIVAVTAYALEGDREKCLSAGMDGYISKPIKIGELKAALELCSSKLSNLIAADGIA
jgi:PAS domain S-box-containing protein